MNNALDWSLSRYYENMQDYVIEKFDSFIRQKLNFLTMLKYSLLEGGLYRFQIATCMLKSSYDVHVLVRLILI